MKAPYPIIVDLSQKQVAVVGGGRVARRKIKKLNEIGVKPTVISPQLVDGIDPQKIKWIDDTYQRQYVAEMDLIIACTDNPELNDRIRSEASHFQLVNNVSDKNHSDFYNLATIQTNQLLISVSTLGQSPKKAKEVRSQIEQWLKEQQKGD